MSDYELIKCPFCGSNGELHEHEVWEDDDYTFDMYYVCCKDYYCKARTELYYTPRDAIEEWNNGHINKND